ncbi:MAG: DUF4263 domain-containing protein [Acidobacteria bacterium]|nr:DUF4263 domain-containing protein [Acidobacteriota bacterium]
MKELKVRPTSKNSAETDDIILREKDTTRLIFRPLIITNQKDINASVKGVFIYQRKGKNEEWEDSPNINLSKLKAGEGVKLILKGSELRNLYNNLRTLYELYEQEGIPRGTTTYIPIDEGLQSLLNSNDYELIKLLDNNPQNGSKLLSKLLTWISKADDPIESVKLLQQLDINNLQQLNSVIGIQTFNIVLNEWKKNTHNNNESFWQNFFTKYSFVLSQVFASPVIIFGERAYLGGKSISNEGGKNVDFVLKNEISNNIVLLEIKTPATKLLGGEYRNVNPISSELSGAIAQIINYKDTLQKEYHSILAKSENEFKSFEPNCVIIAGNYRNQIISKEQSSSFELFRSHLHGIEIITYDELFERIKQLVDFLSGNNEEGF